LLQCLHLVKYTGYGSGLLLYQRIETLTLLVLLMLVVVFIWLLGRLQIFLVAVVAELEIYYYDESSYNVGPTVLAFKLLTLIDGDWIPAVVADPLLLSLSL